MNRNWHGQKGRVCIACGLAAALVGGALLTRHLHGGSSAGPEPSTPSGAGGMAAWFSSRLPAGAAAADFALPGLEPGQEVRLSSFARHEPVVLIFGSFT